MIRLASIAFVASVLFGLPAIAQEPSERTADTARLVISGFKKPISDERFERLNLALPEMIAVGLLPYDSIETMTEAALQRALSRFGDTGIKVPAYDDELLELMNVDYVLRGELIAIRGSLILSGVVEGDSRRFRQRVEPVRFDAKDTFAAVSTFSRRVASIIVGRQAGRLVVRSVAVACLEDQSDPKTKDTLWIGGDLRDTLEILLEDIYQGRIVDVEATPERCEDNEAMLMLAKQQNVDAVIGGLYRVVSNRLTVAPSIYVAKGNFRLKMPELSGETNDYHRMKGWSADSLGEVLNALLSYSSLRELKRLAESEPNQRELLQKGKQFLDEGKTDLALIHFERAAAVPPADRAARRDAAQANFEAGKIRLERNQPPLAIDRFKLALAQDDSFTQAWISLGDTYALMQDNESAIEAYARAVRSDPANADVYRKLGDAFTRAGREDEATESYARAVEIEGKDSEVRNLLAVSLLRQSEEAQAERRYEEQYKLLRQAYEFVPERTVLRCYILNDLAIALRSLREFTRARRYMEEFVASDECGASVGALYGLAIMQKNDNRVDLALESLAKAVDKASTDQKLGLQLVIAGYLIHADRKQEGLDLFEAIRPRLIASQGYVVNLAWFYAVAEDRDAFYAALETALQSQRANTLHWLDQEVDVDQYREEPRFKKLMAMYDKQAAEKPATANQ